MLLVTDAAGAVLLEQRPATGIWGGLWCPPSGEDMEGLVERVARATGTELGSPRALDPVRHSFTHFHLDIRPLHMTPSAAAGTSEGAGWRWVAPQELDAVGVPAVMDKLLDKL